MTASEEVAVEEAQTSEPVSAAADLAVSEEATQEVTEEATEPAAESPKEVVTELAEPEQVTEAAVKEEEEEAAPAEKAPEEPAVTEVQPVAAHRIKWLCSIVVCQSTFFLLLLSEFIHCVFQEAPAQPEETPAVRI